MLLEKKEKAVTRERKLARALWIYVVLLSTGFLVIGGMKLDQTLGLWFGILACFWLLMGAVFLFKQLLGQQQLETLKELKGIEVRLMDLQRLIEERNSRP